MKVTIFTKMYPHQLFREVRNLARTIWLDLPEAGQTYYRDHVASWRPGKQDRHILVTADKWVHAAGQTEPVSTGLVMSILLSFRNNVLRVVMRFDESLPFAMALYRELVDINRRIRYDGAVRIEGAMKRPKKSKPRKQARSLTQDQQIGGVLCCYHH